MLFPYRNSNLADSSICLQGLHTRAGASPWPRKYSRSNVQLLQNKPPHLRQWCYRIHTLNHAGKVIHWSTTLKTLKTKTTLFSADHSAKWRNRSGTRRDRACDIHCWSTGRNTKSSKKTIANRNRPNWLEIGDARREEWSQNPVAKRKSQTLKIKDHSIIANRNQFEHNSDGQSRGQRKTM